MLDSNHNFDGEHGAELLAYMYGELDLRSRAEFEKHLALCNECAFELAAFADARLGVIEWKREDFDHLASPVVLIPDAAPQYATVERPITWAGITSWWESILSWPLAARVFGTALAAVTVVAGLVYFVGMARVNNEVAFEPVEPPVSAPDVRENLTQPPRVTAVKENIVVPKTTVDQAKSSDSPRVQLRRTQLAPARTIARNSPVSKVATPKAATAATRKAPRLNSFDDDEDKTLRLSDLLADIGNSDDK